MNIAFVGTGYVGLVTGTCFAEMGNDVTCVDVNEVKIDNLNNGIIPIYEPGLEEMINKNVKANRLHFTTKLEECIDKVSVVFIAVGTPPDEDGSADLKYVLSVARKFGECITHPTVIVTKSTVPVGTAEKVRKEVNMALSERNVDIPFYVASNPEFLKEGSAVDDFMKPDRIVVGCDAIITKLLMRTLYKPFVINDTAKLIFTDIPSAEMIKYAANSMLATRISFMNDIANLCELVGANVDDVRKGIGSDTRIGQKFLYPGCGYGGSCFPKDVQALVKTAEANGYNMRVLKAVESVNYDQKIIPFKKAIKALGNISINKPTVALWGLAFKPDTDDMREATSLVTIELLKTIGATVKVYDPVAMPECKRRVGDNVIYCTDIYDAAKDADVIILLTEWREFRNPNWDKIAENVKNKILIDGRNIYDKDELVAYGFNYNAIGKK